MANDILETGLGALSFSRDVLTSLLEDIPQDKLTHQPAPDANHALWIMGHLAITDAFFLSRIAGQEDQRFEAWKDMFFMGSTPTPDVFDYPPHAEIRDFLITCRGQLVVWFKALHVVQLKVPLPDDLKRFGPTHAGLMTSLAVHEGLHAGQLTLIRRSLGISPKFG